MPLPLTNLDTRRWADLVGEARALIPRFAPSWTDHNDHDPGITLLELLAWLVEHDLYRVNRVPERHRLKFVALAGSPPRAPTAARAAVAISLRDAAATSLLPSSTTLVADTAEQALRFRTVAPLPLTAARIAAVQTFDGVAFTDVTPLWRETVPLPAFGSRPTFDGASSPALLVGLDSPPERDRPFVVRIGVDGGGGDELGRLQGEARALVDACAPVRPRPRCDDDAEADPADPPTPPVPAHHGFETAWELFDAGGWQPLEADDATRALSLAGSVTLTPAVVPVPAQVGSVAEPLVWVRCRAASGRPDEVPVLVELAVNAVVVEQRTAAFESYRIVAGTQPPPVAPSAGSELPLDLTLDDEGAIVALAAGGAGDPSPRVLAYRAATAGADGELIAALVRVGVARSEVNERHALADSAADGEVRVWTLEADGARAWEVRRDLDAAAAGARVVALDASSRELRFGDGLRGRVPPAGAWIVATYDTTAGAAGNVGGAAVWSVADDGWNAAVVGDTAAVSADVERITASGPARGGRDAEDSAAAAGRAAATLWSHERLVELAASADTLDGLDPNAVRALPAPARALTALDYERLALEVPGTRIQRARAWPRTEPFDPSLRAPGAVTVVVVPRFPVDRPEPTPGLLEAVRRSLGLRRTICTRVFVVGPDYVEVTVAVRVRARQARAAAAVQDEVRRRLERYLHPLTGGPSELGWPFGRDVYRSEVLALVDGCDGVDYVVDLTLTAATGEASCGNVCVGPLQLVVSGAHRVEVET